MSRKQTFSERNGIVVKEILHPYEMPQELRNSLWNALYGALGPPNSKSDFWRYLIFNLAVNHWSSPVDNFQGWADKDCASQLRVRFIESRTETWDSIYDLLEQINEELNVVQLESMKDKFEFSVNRALENELAAWRMVNGQVVQMTSSVEIESIVEAIKSSAAAGLDGAAEHLEKATKLLSLRPNPDYPNSIKESISAVESVARKLGVENAGLDKPLKALAEKIQMHGGLREGFVKLYGYTSDESGIRHAIMDQANIGLDEAKYMLVSCSAFVHFLTMKAHQAKML